MSVLDLLSFRLLISSIAIGTLSLYTGCSSSERDLASRNQPLTSMDVHAWDIKAADWNRDGAPDITTVSGLNNAFSIRLNNGDGTFGPVTHYSGGTGSGFIVIIPEDLNGDIKLDAPVLNVVSNDIYIFMGQNDGTFLQTNHYPISDPNKGILGIGSAPFGMVSGDFNNDGKIDLATANAETNNISSLLGNGDGTFQTATVYPLLGSNTTGLVPFGLDIGDFNEDGKQDLASGGSGDTGLVILRGNGDGSFTPYKAYNAGYVISCLHVADFNKDGHQDIVTAAFGSSNYASFLGNGHGSFSLKESKWGGGIAAECFGVGDLNGDGKLDLALVNTLTTLGSSSVAVLLGNGDGTFSAPVNYAVGQVAWQAAMADFNRDGKLDVAVVNGGNTSVSVLFGNGDGTLQPQVVYPM